MLVPESAAFIPEYPHLVPIFLRICVATWQRHVNCAKLCARFDAFLGGKEFESRFRMVAVVPFR